MRTLVIAAASALFFAAIVTELSMRLWPGNYLALLLIAFVALLVSGLINLRLSAAATPRPAPRQQRAGSRARGGQAAGSRPARNDQGQGKGQNQARNQDRGKNQRGPEPPPPEGPREQGTVKWFNRNKGFGFVIRESGEEIFVHQRSIRTVGEGNQRRRPTLRDGQAVNFVVAEREKGLQAEDVVPAEE